MENIVEIFNAFEGRMRAMGYTGTFYMHQGTYDNGQIIPLSRHIAETALEKSEVHPMGIITPIQNRKANQPEISACFDIHLDRTKVIMDRVTIFSINRDGIMKRLGLNLQENALPTRLEALKMFMKHKQSLSKKRRNKL